MLAQLNETNIRRKFDSVKRTMLEGPNEKKIQTSFTVGSGKLKHHTVKVSPIKINREDLNLFAISSGCLQGLAK